MLRRNGPREWIVTILLVSLVIWSWGLGWNSIPGSTHQVEQGAGTFHRRKVRKHRRIKLLQVATRLATQRLIVRVSWCAIAVIALYRSPWSACSTEWPYFLVLGVVSKSSRIETTETENAYVSQFLGSVRIEVPKDDKEGLKLLAAFLRYFVVPPAPRCHGHTLSLREVSQCTHFSPSTVRDIYHRVDAHGLKALLRKHNPNSAIPEDVKERIIQMQIDDPSASGRVLAARLRESNPESQILAEDVASCVVSMDYNEIRPAVRKALGAKSASSYLIDQLFQINQVLLTYAKDLPKSILVQIADIRSIHKEHSDSFCAPWTLDEAKDTTTNTLRRQWKEQAIRGHLAGDSDPAVSCPYCYSSRVRIKEARKTSATTKRGTVQPTESVRYYCMNKECPKKTFTLVDPQRELGAQVTKDVKAEALQVLISITCRDSEYKPSKIRFNLALCLARLGEFQEAKGPLEKLLRDDPDYPQAKAMLEGLDLALNKGYRISEAKEARRRSLVPRPSLLQRFLQFFRR